MENHKFTFNCPHCGQHLEAESDKAGTELDCPGCGKTIQIPKASKQQTLIAYARQAVVRVKESAIALKNKALPIIRNAISKWSTLEARQKKRILIVAASIIAVFAFLRMVCAPRISSREEVIKSANEAARAANDALSRLSDEATRMIEKQEENERALQERIEREARERERKEKQQIAEERERAEHLTLEEEVRRLEQAEKARRREENRIAEEQRQKAEIREREQAEKSRIEEAERYARKILEPLKFQPKDLGWKDIPDTLESDFALALKASLVYQKKGNWMMAALCLATLDKSIEGDLEKSVDFAAKQIKASQKRASDAAQCLGPDFCHLEPVLHIQESLKGKVSLTLKGRYFKDCIKAQRNKDWLELLNMIGRQNADSTFEAYPTSNRIVSKLERTKFSLACKTEITNEGGYRNPKLGILIISVNDYNDVKVDWTKFDEKLPSEDGYMKQGWNLLTADVYVLHTVFDDVYRPYIEEMDRRISQFKRKKGKEVELGDITEDDSKDEIRAFAQKEAATFAKLVDTGELEAKYQRKLLDSEKAAALELDAKAQENIFSQNFGFKVFASKTLVSKGISVTTLGENASIWQDLQKANAKKDWKRICEIFRTHSKYDKNYWKETDKWDDQIRMAMQALREFQPTFSVKINGEDVTRQCRVVVFGQDRLFLEDRGLDDYCEESASGKNPGYRIRHCPFHGDFAIIHIDDIGTVEANGGGAKNFAIWHNNWAGFSQKAERTLEEKQDAKEITKEQFKAQLKELRAKIKGEFIKKNSLSPLNLKLAK